MNLEIKLDVEQIQQKANELATKGVITAIDHYFNSYGGEFQKNIQKQIDAEYQGISVNIPNVIALLNQKLEQEITKLVNDVIPTTIINKIKNLTIDYAPEIITSRDILKKFIECKDVYEKNQNNFECSFKQDDQYGWYNVTLKYKDLVYHFTLHQTWANKDEYRLLSMTLGDYRNNLPKLKTIIDGSEVEFPMNMSVLDDDFQLFLTTLYLRKTKIKITEQEFTDEMFYEIDEDQ